MVYTYPDEEDFAATVKEAWRVAHEDEAAAELRPLLESTQSALQGLIAELEARIRDPHPLFESVTRALRDVFRGK